MVEKKAKKAEMKELSPIDIYSRLPKTNCKECGEENCMAFATKLVNKEITLDKCPPLLKKEHEKVYKELLEMLKPPVKEIVIGVGDRAVKVGGKLVLYRHEFTYSNPTAIAIDVTDEMPDEELICRVKKADGFNYGYIGQSLKLNMMAVRSTSGDPEKFRAAVKKVSENTNLPLVLCSFNPEVMEHGLMVVLNKRPLIYAATQENWKDMAELSLMYNCPLAVFAPNDLKLLKSMAKTLMEYGVQDVLLDPGTFPDEGLGDTISNFTMIRRAATKESDELLGLPLIGTPIVAWKEQSSAPEVSAWKEAYAASMLIIRYADMLIMHSADGWVLLPTVVLRQNIYTDPRKPVAVQPGLRVIGNPDGNSPVLMTTNFALTYFTVSSDIESAGLNCYLLVIDTEGTAVDSGVAGRKLTSEKVADALKVAKMDEKVKHRKLIIPGKAARLSGEIEELSGWKVMVGPGDSSEIPKFVKDKWQ